MALSYYRIKHPIPGRMRIKSFSMRRNPPCCRIVSNGLREMAGIHDVSLNPLVGSALILYNKEKVNQKAILEKLDELFSPCYLLDKKHSLAPVASPNILKPKSLIKDVLEVAAFTCIMVYLFIKSVFGKTPPKETAFSLPAAAAAFFGYPVIKQAVRDGVDKKRISLHQFMAFTAIVAIFMAEAMTAPEIIFIMRVRTLIKDYITERSRRAVRNILSLHEKKAYQVIDGTEVATPVSELKAGAIVAVHTVERIPVDGVIVSGHATIDDSHITGRSVPEYMSTGSKVFAGTVVHDGALHIEAEKVGSETDLARVLEMVEESFASRPPVMDQGDILSARLTRLGTIVSAGTLIATQSIQRVLTVLLVMSCPCATVLAASTAVSAALANAARKNILVKDGLYLEEVGKADVICFDKTGTVTCSRPEVEKMVINNKEISQEDLIATAASAELHSHHPLP